MFGVRISKLGSASKLGLIAKAIAILRKYGTDAHVYLPGIGTVSGLTAGNYLDSAGVTTASVDNPVGLSLDALQAMTLGSELQPGIVGSYAGSINQATFPVTCTSTAAGNYGAQNTILTLGKTYKITVSWSGNTSGRSLFADAAGLQSLGNSASGSSSYFFKAIDVISYVYATGAAGAGESFTITSVSVREIPGIHATQGTTANKPILRRGLFNQFLQCQTPNNAAWTNANLNVTLGQASSPYGTSDSALLAPTAVSGSHVLFQNNVTISRNVTIAFIAKAGVLQFLSPSNAGAGVLTSTFDLVSGTSANGASTTSSMVSLGGGWWLGAMSFTAAYTAASLYINNSSSASTASFAGNGTDGLYMYRAGLFDGTYTAQQIIDAGGIPLTTSAAASSATGKYWWQFDGSNDSLSLSAPLFQMSDDHCVIAGVNQTIAANGYVFSQNNTAATTLVGAIAVTSGGFARALWGDDIGTTAFITGSVPITGVTKVITVIKRTNAKQLRVNGAQDGATNNTAMGATTLNTASIGSYTTAGNFTGSIYPVIAIKGTVTDADLLTLERFVGQLSGVTGI